MKYLFLFHLVGIVGAGNQMRCVFLHGVGMPNSSPLRTSEADWYWGGPKHINKYTPYCSSRVFLHQDTMNYGWDDVGLQQTACTVAVGEDHSDNVIRKQKHVIRNTIIIAHSMGNLIFAGALQRRFCSIDLASSQWISLNAPWLGSKASSWVQNICSNQTSSKPLKWLAKDLNYCDPKGQVYRSYETLEPNYPGLQDLQNVGVAYVTRAMCGTSAFGLTSSYSAAFEAMDAEVHYGQDNDGLVAVDSCMLPGKTYQKNYAESFYLARINHIDGTCRFGNGAFGNVDRQPGLWLAGAQNTTGQLVIV